MTASGRTGMTGSGFYWATGIEDTFIPQTGPGQRRLDEYELTHHYRCWKQDLDRVAELGVQMLRYGIPWYRVNPRPGVYDWEWTDRVLDTMVNEKGIIPIIDLMHYGTPLWLENQFANADYPRRVAEYAAAFADRYRPLVRYYTPLNEPFVHAEFCGRIRRWPPRLEGDGGFVTVMKHLCRGIVETVRAIRSVDPAAVMVHVEATGIVHTEDPSLQREAEGVMDQRLTQWELVTGKVEEGHFLWDWLRKNGLRKEEAAWFQTRAIAIDVMGLNYYPELSVHEMVKENGEVALKPVWGGAEGLKAIVRSHYQRYGRPIFITETSTNAKQASREGWLKDSVQAIRELRQSGVPVIGYTWWPLYDLINWDYREGIQPVEAYVEPMGLWELAKDTDGLFRRKPTGMVETYRQMVRSTSMPPLPAPK